MIRYPHTEKNDFTEELHGRRIADPYRWLENVDDAKAADWIGAQNALTDQCISSISEKGSFKNRLLELLETDDLKLPIKRAGGMSFYLRKRPGRKQYALCRAALDMSGETVIFDPNESNALRSVDAFEPSPSGALLAYLVSENGCETGAIAVISTKDGRALDDGIKWSRYTGIVWTGDEKGFYFSKVDDRRLNEKIYFHEIGKPEDTLVFGQNDPEEAIMGAYPSFDRKFVLIDRIVNWDRNDVFIARLDGKHEFFPLLTGYDGISSVRVNGGAAFIETNIGAPNKKIMATPLPDFASGERIVLENKAKTYTIIPEKKNAIENFALTENYLVVNYTEDVKSRLVVFDTEGDPSFEIGLPEKGVAEVHSAEDGDLVLIGFSSFTRPEEIDSLDLSTGVKKEIFRSSIPVDPSKFTVKQVFYASKDGTRVPMYIVSQKNVPAATAVPITGEDLRKAATTVSGTFIGGANTGDLDGGGDGPRIPGPLILNGYGGFNLSMLPSFSPLAIAWVESGGIFALANMRGGGEYGENWHAAGKRAKKQNVFDDFIAAAEFLIEERYTIKERLAIYGRSNGGLLIGAVVTQRPDLFGAAVCGVPLLDMTRFHKFLIGKYWVDEYGNPDEARDLDFILGYSPYQRAATVKYPPFYTFTALSDTRVHPMHALKMTAKLQEAATATQNESPALLRVETKAGHGMGKPADMQAEAYAEQLAFIFRHTRG